MEKEIDINERYEQIFGKSEYPNIYSPDDEEYNTLRQEIIGANKEYFSQLMRNSIFVGVKLIPYEEYQVVKAAEEIRNRGFMPFFIKKILNSKNVVYAAGYFDNKRKKFFVVKDSYCPVTCFANIIMGSDFFEEKGIVDTAFKLCNGVLHQTQDVCFKSASVAASFYLGKKATYKDWKSAVREVLLTRFDYYMKPEIDTLEHEYELKIIESYVKVAELEAGDTKVNKQTTGTPINIPIIKHIFYYKILGRTIAKGYYDIGSHNFYIMKDSLVIINTDFKFAFSKLEEMRNHFLRSVCNERDSTFLKVLIDAKCRSASVAAFYVSGNNISAGEWRDENGLTLKDFYSDLYFDEGCNQYLKVHRI